MKSANLKKNLITPEKAAWFIPVFISSGIAPALFCKFNEKLDIFYPYAMGVEWIDTYEEKIENNLNI